MYERGTNEKMILQATTKNKLQNVVGKQTASFYGQRKQPSSNVRTYVDFVH